MCYLAIALHRNGYEVGCSGVGITEPLKTLLVEENLLPENEGWFPENIKRNIDCIVPSPLLCCNNSELLRARELCLLVLPFTEFIFRLTKDKIRVVIGGLGMQSRLMSIIIYALEKQNLLCDYVGLENICGQKSPIKLGYDSRIILLQVDDCSVSQTKLCSQYSFYRPHILLNSTIVEEQDGGFPGSENYLRALNNMIATIERDGKYIFSGGSQSLELLGEKIREDITAIPYQPHAVVKNNGRYELVTRFGNYPLHLSDLVFLSDLNAARLTCHQLGVKDKDFYGAVSEYSFLYKNAGEVRCVSEIGG